MTDQTVENWQTLSAETRAQLLLRGIPFPGETPHETRCRLKNDLQLYDDTDLTALLDKSADTLARLRVKGTGPVPIRIAREIFYDRTDVARWIKQHRDGAEATA
ncbi:helix-turn-helix transcriptional regulator [Phaeobacter marinintestinus]|uniref:helix-turn-helix transcriptional regulator n=1 Tax=Falsiphaeobacter marinintestinus TaxID=1492905 RepID=UPI0011B624D7|nr:hypothetical protein [Phaeobacter marinintestinus]